LEELIGFIAGNAKREKIMALLGSKGAQDGAAIAKMAHIVGADKILDELAQKGLITSRGGKYALTETGVQVERRMHGVR